MSFALPVAVETYTVLFEFSHVLICNPPHECMCGYVHDCCAGT